MIEGVIMADDETIDGDLQGLPSESGRIASGDVPGPGSVEPVGPTEERGLSDSPVDGVIGGRDGGPNETTEETAPSKGPPGGAFEVTTASSGERADGSHSGGPAGDDEVTSPPPPVAHRSRIATLRKLFRRSVVTVATLAVLVAVLIGALALANGSWEVNPILSGSMRPGLSVGGVVISERVPVSQLVLRDVIVFQEPNNPATQIVHRIIKMTKSKSGEILINTQGDANNAPDPWTLTIKGEYAYRARWTLPLLGYVAVAYENNRGLFLLGAGVVLIAAGASTVLSSRRRGLEPAASED